MEWNREKFRNQARILKALSHEARLLIVHRLHAGECSAGQLTELVGLDQSTVSKHLAVLRNLGIVDDRRVGSSVMYRLCTPCVVSFFACASQVLAERGRNASASPEHPPAPAARP